MDADQGEDRTDADSTRRIVVANGMDVDKQYRYEVTKRIAWDLDIRKLSLFGPPMWAALSIGLVVWIGRGLYRSGAGFLFGLLDAVEQFVLGPLPVLADNAAYVLGAVAFVVFFLRPAVGFARNRLLLRNRLDVLRVNVANFVDVLTPEVWKNLNYWHPLTTHLSDRDPLVVLSEDVDAEVSGLYADGPHYGNVFVDSVYIKVDGDVGWRARLLGVLYDHRSRVPRLGAMAAVVLVVGLWSLDRFLATDLPLYGDLVPWQPLVLAALAVGVGLLSLMAATGYPGFLARFYADSAGLSGYERLLNEPGMEVPTGGDERVSLSNSMWGYGVFFVSEFLHGVLGDRDYYVDVDADGLVDGDDASFPADGFEPAPEDAHAVAAASEILWSSVPPASVREADEDASVRLSVEGVDYYTFADAPAGRLARVRTWLADRLRPGDDDRDRRHLVKATAGRRRGIRLPVKKAVSVPHGTTAADVEGPPGEEPLLYDYDGWEEDERHYLLLGGGEHQQGVNKLVLSLKAQGYENVDVLENAFSGVEVPDQQDADLGGEEPIYESALFPTEYFVSFVGGDEDFFRQDDSGFLLLRHEMETDEGSHWVHVLVGMSATGTKVGFLYWLDQLESDDPFAEVDPDVVHFVSHPGPNDFEDVEDVGHLYLDTDWYGTGRLQLSLRDDDSLDDVPARTGDGDDGRKRLGMRYHELELSYE